MLRKRATSSSSRCLRLVDLHSSMGNAKRCEGMERRGESQLEGEENKGGMEEEAPWVVDTGVGENVGRRTLLDCLLPPRPSLLLLSLPSVKGGRARSPSTLRKQLLSLDSILQGATTGSDGGRDGYRYTAITDILNRRFPFYITYDPISPGQVFN